MASITLGDSTYYYSESEQQYLHSVTNQSACFEDGSAILLHDDSGSRRADRRRSLILMAGEEKILVTLPQYMIDDHDSLESLLGDIAKTHVLGRCDAYNGANVPIIELSPVNTDQASSSRTATSMLRIAFRDEPFMSTGYLTHHSIDSDEPHNMTAETVTAYENFRRSFSRGQRLDGVPHQAVVRDGSFYLATNVSTGSVDCETAISDAQVAGLVTHAVLPLVSAASLAADFENDEIDFGAWNTLSITNSADGPRELIVDQHAGVVIGEAPKHVASLHNKKLAALSKTVMATERTDLIEALENYGVWSLDEREATSNHLLLVLAQREEITALTSANELPYGGLHFEYADTNSRVTGLIEYCRGSDSYSVHTIPSDVAVHQGVEPSVKTHIYTQQLNELIYEQAHDIQRSLNSNESAEPNF